MKKLWISCSILLLAGCNSNISTEDIFTFNEAIEKIEISSAVDTIEITSTKDIAIIKKSMQDASSDEGTHTDIGASYVLEFYYEQGSTTNIGLFYDIGDDTGAFDADTQRYVLNDFNASDFERIFKELAKH